MTLTVRSGAAAGTKSAQSMAEYMAETKDVPELAARLTDYFGERFAPHMGQVAAAIPARDMHPLAAEMMGIDITRSLTKEEATHLLAGRRADGKPISGKTIQASTRDKVRVAFTDFTFSAPKSFSIALAFAKTDAERTALMGAFQRANEQICRVIEAHIGRARMGDNGRNGVIPGHMAVFRYNHNTSRPTVRIADGKDTITVATSEGSVFRPGDMQTHIHNIFTHATITDDGVVRAPFLYETHDRVHEWGALGHAFLVTALREAGIQAGKDPRTDLSFLPSVPETAVKLFSSRTEEGEVEARKLAAEKGIDWNTASARVKIDLIKTKVAVERQDKDRAPMGDLQAWENRAAAAGYVHQSVVDPDHKWQMPSPGERTRIAYEAGNPLLGEEFKSNAKLNGSALRIMAARGMIASGVKDWTEIEDVVAAFKSEGIVQEGKATSLISVPEHGKKFGAVTTGLHVDRELEAIRLLKTAGNDRTGAITKWEFANAAARVAKAKGYDFSSEHGQKQYVFGEAMATAGRAAVGIGGAGVGKTVIAEAVIEAHHARGYRSVGTTKAWRQTHGLIEAGVDSSRRKRGLKLEPDTSALERYGVAARDAYAMDPFLRSAESGAIKLDAMTIVVGDEIATLDTLDVLRLGRLQDEHGFKFIGWGDEGQCQSIGAGNVINIFRHALGKDQVPQLLETIRQKRIADRDTAGLWRKGSLEAAQEALCRKDKDGLLDLVPGSYTDVVKAGVNWYEQRIADRTDRTNYSIGISVPTNADVRAVGLEVRTRRRATGVLQGEDLVIPAIDPRGAQSEMAIAVGDTVRLFKRTNASLSKTRHGYFGENGTIADIVSIDPEHGLRLRRQDGAVGAVRWSSMQDKDTGRVLLAYGSALTINTRQSETLTDHLTLLPGGTAGVNAFSIYPADTRNREDSMIIASQGAEKAEVINHRPLGDPWVASATADEMRAEIMKNMARNLGRRPEKQLGVDMIDKAADVEYGSVNAQTASWYRSETTVPPQTEPAPAATATSGEEIAKAIAAPLKRLGGPKEVRAQKRSMRSAAERPKRQSKPRQETTQTEACMEFTAALRSSGFRLRGEPVMDGKWYRVAVEGDRGPKKSGRYRGYLDGRPVGFIENFKTGQASTWRSDQPVPVMTAAEYRQREADRAARQSARDAAENRAMQLAASMWAGGKGVGRHPYLERKGVKAHDVRVNRRGNLLLPMRDDNRVLRSVQMIYPDGTKRFPKDGRKSGLFGQIGEIDPARPYMIAEGYATAASLHEITGFPVVYAYDAVNVVHVGLALKAKYPEAMQIYAGDNDHHLPRQIPPLPNTGKDKAEVTAKETGGVLLLPSFGEIETNPFGKGETPPTDWNDFAKLYGKQKTYAEINARLKSEGIEMAIQPDKDATKITAKERPVPTESDTAREAARKLASPASQNQSHADQQRARDTMRHGNNRGPRL